MRFFFGIFFPKEVRKMSRVALGVVTACGLVCFSGPYVQQYLWRRDMQTLTTAQHRLARIVQDPRSRAIMQKLMPHAARTQEGFEKLPTWGHWVEHAVIRQQFIRCVTLASLVTLHELELEKTKKRDNECAKENRDPPADPDVPSDLY